MQNHLLYVVELAIPTAPAVRQAELKLETINQLVSGFAVHPTQSGKLEEIGGSGQTEMTEKQTKHARRKKTLRDNVNNGGGDLCKALRYHVLELLLLDQNLQQPVQHF